MYIGDFLRSGFAPANAGSSLDMLLERLVQLGNATKLYSGSAPQSYVQAITYSAVDRT